MERFFRPWNFNDLRRKVDLWRDLDEDLKTRNQKVPGFRPRPGPIAVNEPLAAADVDRFERKYEVRLPDDYRELILRFGDGHPSGRGDDVLRPLLSAVDYPEYLHQPFPGFQEYVGPGYLAGSLAIGGSVPGRTVRLVLVGQHYGSVWVDNTASSAGVVPWPDDVKIVADSRVREYYPIELQRRIDRVRLRLVAAERGSPSSH